MKVMKNQSIWYERYKPQRVDDVILPKSILDKFKGYVQNQDIPAIGLFSSLPGTGKSSLANAIITELGSESLWINASMERGIDVLRGRIQKFASQSSFDGNIKMVVMDECLEENEAVRIGTLDNWSPVKLNELAPNKVYECVSFNMETGVYENDTCEIISDKTDEIFEVELEDGRTIKVTGNHPFIININGTFKEKSINEGLNESDDIVCVGEINERSQ